MRTGKRPKDPALIDALFTQHVARAEKETDPYRQFVLFTNLAADFKDFKDVSSYANKAAELKSRKEVRAATEADQKEDRRETQISDEVYRMRDRMAASQTLKISELANLRRQLKELSKQAQANEDSSERRVARRVLTGFIASSRQIRDEQFQQLLQEVAPQQPRRE
jgi:hypothetical protein